MNRKDAFNTLGVPENCSEEELKKAYRKKAMEFHPDRNPGNKEAEEKFKQIALAYEAITKGTTATSTSDFEEFFSSGSFGGDFSANSFFREFFSKSNRKLTKKSRPGEMAIKMSDAEISNWSMSLTDALLREEITINLNVKACCGQCLGNDKIWKECSQCKGMGVILERINTNIGVGTRSTNCAHCKAKGWKKTNMCNICNSNLTYDKAKTISFRLPENYKLGQQLRLKGKGNESWKAPDADIYITPSITLTDLSLLSDEDKQKLKELFEKR